MEQEKIWKQVLEEIKISVSPANFSTWLSQTFIYSLKEIDNERNLVEVGCPSSFIADTVEKKYAGLLQDSLNRVTSKKNDLSFVVKQVTIKEFKEEDNPLFATQEKPATTAGELNDALRRSRVRLGFTFTNFAVSSTNSMAFAAAEAVSRTPGTAYNPLFLYGGVGVGKTHLMLAVAHKMLSENPRARVLYCMGEEFTTEIVDAIRMKTTQEFKKRYRNLDLLMLDDVQFLAGKTAVQEEFFHTFNTLLREGGQVILTSDRPPSEIQRLEERIKSRFEAGLIIDISPPDFETRAAISLIKAQEKGMILSQEVAELIAVNIDSPRKIEGFLTRIITETSSTQEPITTDLINRILGKTNQPQESNLSRAVVPQVFIDAVANYYSLGKRKLLGDTRARPVAVPRQILMYLLRVELGLPLQEVGRLVGGRDHTTVMHAVEKISANLSTDSTLRNDLLGIKRSMSG